ncbi:MAG TPA: TonB-dependent receptor [Opitutus sp.]|nr:TonB-dependent receptor [Opitutus sp.]
MTATRTAEVAGAVPFSHVALAGDELRASPNASVDGTLRAIPGFSLFRRSDSLVANPTTQGVSLRGLGPSGASRSLVLLDGVPLNDPFGGWVLWSQVPRESLARLEIVPGGGGTAWGDAALGGVIQLFTEPALGERERVAARTGSFGTHDVELQATEPVGRGTVQLLGRWFSTDGYYVVAPEDRGSIDRPASSRARWGTARWRQPLGAGVTATVTFRRFAEDRGNGTPYQQNATDATFASVALDAQASAAWHWSATAYAQSETYSSTFSSVDATRSAETPASNQFAVPSTALGAAWVGEWTAADGSHTTFGLDARDVRGETREDSAYANGAFTRERFAGGRQTIAGAFIEHSRALAGDARVTAGVRADGWWDNDGHRRDFLLGASAGDTEYPDHDGTAFSPSAGIVWPVNRNLRLHVSGQHAFRRPTLNELYRPFRVGNVITDANPDLRTETVTSGEIGADAAWGGLHLSLAAFDNELHDAVANVTIAKGPVTLPGIGFVPAGGEGRRRLNLDRVRVQGVAADASWPLAPGLDFTLRYLLDVTEVLRASVAPNLEGLRLAEVPRQSAIAGLSWRAGRWMLAPRVRWVGGQFDDDQNTLRLAPFTVVDVSASCTLRSGAEVFASAENLFDERIETGRSADGLVNTGTPRLLLIGFRWWR